MCLSTRMCTTCAQRIKRSEEDIRFSGTGVIGGCKTPCGCLELNQGLLKEQQVLLPAKPCAQTLYYILIALR